MIGIDNRTLGVLVAGICKSPIWDECWCGKDRQDGGCRWCQLYQVFWGLDPACGDNGKPTSRKLLKQQKDMREKYKDRISPSEKSDDR